jgi:hypothetical protein
VFVWDDEKDPDEHIGLPEQIRRNQIARGIATAVSYLRRRVNSCPRIDPIPATVTILDDLRDKSDTACPGLQTLEPTLQLWQSGTDWHNMLFRGGNRH